MANLREFFNKISNNDRIFTREDIGNMSSNEFQENEKAIDYQLANLGVPTNSDMALSDDVVYVHSYTRDDGTKVKSHYRSISGHITGAASNMTDNSNVMQRGVGILKTYPHPPVMTTSELTLDLLGLSASNIMPVAGDNLQNARRNFVKAKKNDNAHIIYSRSEIKNKGLNDLMDKVGIPRSSRGVIYDINSQQSKKLFKSPEIQNFISNNYSKLINSKQNSTADIEFIKHSKLDDNYYGIQHCKLYNPHITSDGYFNAMVVDYFDFERRNGNSFSVKINNWGYSMQEKGFLENQFNIYQIQEKLW